MRFVGLGDELDLYARSVRIENRNSKRELQPPDPVGDALGGTARGDSGGIQTRFATGDYEIGNDLGLYACAEFRHNEWARPRRLETRKSNLETRNRPLIHKWMRGRALGSSRGDASRAEKLNPQKKETE